MGRSIDPSAGRARLPGTVRDGAARQVPIGDYGLIGDTRSGALVAPDGSIDWWCVPRFDSPPLFGRLVGGDDAGAFQISPAEPVRATRRAYRPDTATLVTTWLLDGAELELVDGLVGDVAGRLLPANLLVRRVTCRGRPARVRVLLAPRFGYDRRPAARVSRLGPALVFQRGALAVAATADGLDLAPDRPMEAEVAAGSPVTFALAVSSHGPLVVVPPDVAADALARDERRWRSWSAGLHAPVQREAVTRSLITLRLLTYSPSGAPVAAPTTSLPELVGGGRNWDYRFAWPRDASIGIAAFLAAGRESEARAFLAWLLHASRLARPHLPVLFTLHGQHGPGEQSLPDWPGYAGSRPVRRGNGANLQHQLDGYGWVLDAAWLLEAAGHRLYTETWRTMAGFADHVGTTWRLPDAGIWEQRGQPTHHVHSKLMAWTALDRAARIAAHRGDRRGGRTARWIRERDALGADIRAHGFDEALGAYTGTYGGRDLDAAVLLLPVLEFDPPTSPRVPGTVEAIRRRLGAGGPLVYRYLPGSDGLDGGEGAFLPCSFWLVQALARTGRRDEAGQLFADLLDLGGPLGLYGEEMDPSSHEHLGNYPQALSHAALIQAALALAAA
ncbi:MAG TPA: glycoside hydrolase family 15 protein [Actinomycetes bacterium]